MNGVMFILEELADRHQKPLKNYERTPEAPYIALITLTCLDFMLRHRVPGMILATGISSHR
jgi:hypothetical protein